MVGDDFAKTIFSFPEKYLDCTNKLFFEVWRDAVNKSFQEGGKNEVKSINPFEQVSSSGSSKWKV